MTSNGHGDVTKPSSSHQVIMSYGRGTGGWNGMETRLGDKARLGYKARLSLHLGITNNMLHSRMDHRILCESVIIFLLFMIAINIIN